MCKLSHSIVEHVLTVQGHKVKLQTAITPPRIVRFHSNFAQSFIKSQTIQYEGSRSKVKGPGHGVKVQGQSVTQRISSKLRSKTATDRLSDFKLATGDVLKGIGPARRRAASSCNAFAIATFSSWFENWPSCVRFTLRLAGHCSWRSPADGTGTEQG